MVVKCENCQTKFNFPEKYIKPEGTNVRCSKCHHRFVVLANQETESEKSKLNNNTQNDNNTNSVKSEPDKENLQKEVDISDVKIVELPGSTLNASNTKQFKQDMEQILLNNSKIIFDMSQMNFVDSSGCGTIAYCHKIVKEKGGELKLCNLTKPVSAIFRLIRMDRKIDIFNTQEEALNAFKK